MREKKEAAERKSRQVDRWFAFASSFSRVLFFSTIFIASCRMQWQLQSSDQTFSCGVRLPLLRKTRKSETISWWTLERWKKSLFFLLFFLFLFFFWKANTIRSIYRASDGSRCLSCQFVFHGHGRPRSQRDLSARLIEIKRNVTLDTASVCISFDLDPLPNWETSFRSYVHIRGI